MKKIFFITVLLTVNPAIQSAPITSQRAREKATRFFAQQLRHPAKVYAVANPLAAVTSAPLMRTANTTASPTFYIFNESQGRGFVILSGDDAMPELIAYSNEGGWGDDESENANENLHPVLLRSLESYDAFVRDLREGRVQASAFSTAVADGNPPVEIVSPLLKTQWNQTYPYNKYAPKVPVSSWVKKSYQGHFAIGCGSVALAQIMKYYEAPLHPQNRLTSYSYECFHEGYGDSIFTDTATVQLTSTTTFDYANMPNKIDYTAQRSGLTETEFAKRGEALGRFLQNIAYGYNTWWTQGSGSVDDCDILAGALVSMGMSYDAHLYIASPQKLNEKPYWDLIVDDLSNNRPIYAAGASADLSSGHAFNFDGYDSKGFVHVNWGWGGSANAFYDPAILNPYGDEYPAYAFNGYNMIIHNLHPRTNDEPLPLDTLQAFSYLNPYINTDTLYCEQGRQDTISTLVSVACPLRCIGYDFDLVTLLLNEQDEVVDTFGVSMAPCPLADTTFLKSCDSVLIDYIVPATLQAGTYTLQNRMRAYRGQDHTDWYTTETNHRTLVVTLPTKIDDEKANANENLNADCYDLQGRTLTHPSKGQIYIQNGRKWRR